MGLLPLDELQDGTTYASCPVSNTPEFTPMNNSLNNDILNSLCIHIVLICYVLDGEAIDEEENNMHFSYLKPTETDRGVKKIWHSQMGGTPSSARIIEDVNREL